ncbi:hypothetical protein [Lacipirellula parvula]|uniref:Uncharacterized protein n=1 Tax=Lacipirellula parvula TaxID=2650471 RepID=A0A5K7XIK5_9BACT|nr:hypothetical protein [Lacipirellula parvula]BBO35922.1 hypothetical protein PLANPX_5534 [Lacipirellula parvula]
MKYLTKLVKAFGIGLAVCLLLAAPFLAVGGLWWTTLQTAKSPDGRHTARVVRSDHIDRNYSIYVDGRRVFISPDFAPRRDIAYHEELAWDDSGNILVFEVAGQRLFGYDVAAGRKLDDDELLAVKLAPKPELWEYYYESEWPGVGRARRS